MRSGDALLAPLARRAVPMSWSPRFGTPQGWSDRKIVIAIDGFRSRFRAWSEPASERKYTSRSGEVQKYAAFAWARLSGLTVAIEQRTFSRRPRQTLRRTFGSDNSRRTIRSPTIARLVRY